MSSGSDVTWLSILEDKLKELHVLIEQGYQIPKGPLERGTFRERFEHLCRQQKVKDRVQLEYSYLDTYQHVIDIAAGVTKTSPSLRDCTLDQTLESLVWRVALSTLQHGCAHGASVSMLVNLLIELNKTIPSFKANIGRFPHDKQVQRPLQDVYALFFDSYVEVLKIIGKTKLKSGRDFTQDKLCIDLVASTKTRIEDARARFDNLTKQAASREETERTLRKRPSHGKEIESSGHIASQSQQETCNVEYVVGERRGAGSYGVVHKVKEKSTGADLVRKRILFSRGLSQEELESKVKNEVWIMRNLHHDNIVTLAGFTQDSFGFSIFVQPVAKYHLKEYFEECLNNKFDESLIRHINPWFGCLLDALAYTHKKEIRHRDIKPTNILIEENTVYLCDFGLAKNFTGQGSSASRGPTPEGTEEYRAPENIMDEPRGRLADVFSLGCVFAEMFTVTHGRSAQDFRNERQPSPFRSCLPKVQDWLLQLRNTGHDYSLCEVILRMLKENPDDRLEAKKALDLVRYHRDLWGL